MFYFWACAEPADQVGVDPTEVDLGEVEFSAEVPDGGFASVDLVFTNLTEEEDLRLTLPGYDGDRLCIEGFDAGESREMTTMGPGSTYVLTVGVCAYLMGEQTTLVETGISVETSLRPSSITVPIRFTPVRVDG